MNGYVIDSWAWMEYMDGSVRGKKVREIVEKSGPIFSAAITVAEVTSKIKRQGMDFVRGRDAIASNSRIISLDEGQAFVAGQIHADMRKENPDFGLADAIVIAAARQLNVKILTGDPDFKNVKEAVLI